MDLGLTGSTAVVTGGSKGMGLAIATTFAEEGAKVAVMARGAEALDEAVAKLRDAGAPGCRRHQRRHVGCRVDRCGLRGPSRSGGAN